MIEAIRAWLLSLMPWGSQAVIWAQAHSTPVMDRLWMVASILGDGWFFFVLVPVMYWCIDKRAGRAMAYVLLLSVYVNSFIKHVFLIPRPSGAEVRVLRPVNPFSPNFPSGHAQNSTVVFGFLASRVRRQWFWVLATVLALLVSVSRIYVGVHDPVAVLGGLVGGALFLALCLWLLPRAGRWLGSRSLPFKLALAVILPVAGLLLHRPDMRGLYPAPDAATTMGAMLGMSVGFLLEPHAARFRVDGPWGQRLLRGVLGLAVTGLLYGVPKLLIPDGLAHGLDMALRFLRYALSGLGAILLAPWLFVRLRLARSDGES